jgi:hypothetical protein
MGAVCLLLAACAPMVLASTLRALARLARFMSDSQVYAAVLGALSVALVAWPGSQRLLFPDLGAPLLSGWALALPLGYAAFRLDLHVTRRARRRARAIAFDRAADEPKRTVTPASPWRAANPAALDAGKPKPDAGPTPLLQHLIGVLEESGFRALPIVMLVQALPAMGLVFWTAVVGLWFAWAHATSDALQAWAKLPLSAAASTALLLGGLLPAMLVHASFNALVLHWLRRTGRPA